MNEQAVGSVGVVDPAAVDLPRAVRPSRLARLLHHEAPALIAMRRFHAPARTRAARPLTRA